MITGAASALHEATFLLEAQDAAGQFQLIEVVIDTGFSDCLTLPPARIAAMRLPWFTQVQGMLADGTLHSFDVYHATIIWDGQARLIEVQANDVKPLAGMRLLQGHELRMQIVPGGAVTIEALP